MSENVKSELKENLFDEAQVSQPARKIGLIKDGKVSRLVDCVVGM